MHLAIWCGLNTCYTGPIRKSCGKLESINAVASCFKKPGKDVDAAMLQRTVFFFSLAQVNMCLEALTYILVLRCLKQSLPPVVYSWSHIAWKDVMDMHALFVCDPADDPALRMTQETLRFTDDFLMLQRGLPVLRDCWQRWKRRTSVVPGELVTLLQTLAAIENVAARDPQRIRGEVLAFLNSPTCDDVEMQITDQVLSWRENWFMSKHDEDISFPDLKKGPPSRRWAARALRPCGDIEVDMPLPDVSQDEFDFLLQFWHQWTIVPWIQISLRVLFCLL